ncbi:MULTISPECIES: branched-chain amino acid ABC transporter permease [Methylibium]|uniref:Putative branched-chain amino acid transport permease n=1 Tax=Methylibium petroleiphilum (strain ATCC BAA-1232 / LMG 22953 / PM1) TaxID=420662 RepID=A2SMC2_METPP|nr:MULTISPECIES: branched-chain amino acid ABC transporter permease [Methylibium]ABM96711.1 putative branched-chain amino acid transport permease [Methylibium petroleiphilum PM1]EWS54410.1 leucine/isoleucine/valine transporter permease subunit [Methylibium sp. T29]EWS58874.1 leucine/isoleucine/valine transporter permease subunit [Methylibium sp. T29-B]
MTPQRSPLLGYAALFIAIALLPALGAYPIFVMKVLCYALFACAFNLLIGFTGLLSFGHAAFLGAAAYGAGHALKVWGFPAPLGLLFGAAVAALAGLAFGWLAIRRSGIYFSMITLALAQMLFFFFLQAPFTGGEDGLQSVPRGRFLGLDLANDLTLYYVVLAIFIAGFWLIYRTVHSPFGQVLTSIRENEARATSLGYDVERFKLVAFVLSAALAGLAGATKTLVLGFATLTDAVWTTSGAVILMTLVGGMGTMVGPMVGALVIVALENKIGDVGRALAELTGIAWFNGLGEAVTLVTGLIFILCVLAFRRGIVGEAGALLARWRRA